MSISEAKKNVMEAAASLESARRDLQARIADVERDETRSDDWKAEQVEEARKQFAHDAPALVEKVTSAAAAFDAEVEAHNSRFAYDGATFAKAASFASLGPTPEPAWRSMLNDLSSPAEISYLQRVFEDRGDIEAAEAFAAKAAKTTASKVGDVADRTYFVGADPLGQASQGLVNDLTAAVNAASEVMGD